MTRTLVEQAEVERECSTLFRFFGATTFESVSPLVADGFLEVVLNRNEGEDENETNDEFMRARILSVNELYSADGIVLPPTLRVCLLRQKHISYLIKASL